MMGRGVEAFVSDVHRAARCIVYRHGQQVTSGIVWIMGGVISGSPQGRAQYYCIGREQAGMEFQVGYRTIVFRLVPFSEGRSFQPANTSECVNLIKRGSFS